MKNPAVLYEKPDIVDNDFPVKIRCRSEIGPTNVFFPAHWHQEIEFIYFLEGEAIVECGSTSIHVVGGDFIVINSNELHKGISISDTLIRYCIIVDSRLFYSEGIGICETKYILPILKNTVAIQNKISEDKKVMEQIQTIIQEYERKDTGFELVIKGRFYELFALLLRKYTIPAEEYTRRNSYLQEFDIVFKYLREHYTEKITLDQICNMVNMSRSHFCRLFKEVTGQTLIEYVNDIRLSKAKAMLQDPNLSITEIALSTGFSDINYFSRLFKKTYQISPSGMRMKNK